MKYVSSIKLLVVSCLVPVLLAPSFVQAQVTPDRAVLLQTIEQLLVQIQALQQILDERQLAEMSTSDIDPLHDFSGTITARYVINGPLQLSTTAPQQHQRYVEQLKQVLPDKYDSYFDQFVIFETDSDTAAFVGVASDGRNTNWVYGVSSEEVIEDPTAEVSIELMVHEFAHLFSLDELIRSDQQTDDCHEYFDDEGCFPRGTYLSEFVQEFWPDGLLDELVDVGTSARAQERFYERYDDEFVTDYAATAPEEDFAETFAWYVLDIEPERGSAAEGKIEFMDSFPSIRSYKTEILSNI